MSLQHLLRAKERRRRPAVRATLAASVGAVVLLLSGCSAESQDEWGRLAMPEPVTTQGEHTLDLWIGAWIAALVTGVLVWGLIGWAVVRYRRRSDDEIPVQTRYNLPLEILYTVAPIIMVVVFFVQTVRVQEIVISTEEPADNVIEVVGQKWSWTFNYGLGELDSAADEENADEEFPYDEYTYEVGTPSYIPTIKVPVDETTKFNLHSPDVIHNFGVPGFLVKMDVIPGRVNTYQVTPKRTGTFAGKCYELCGAYHSRMLFNVEVVERAEYDAYLADLAEGGRQSATPLLGGEDVRTQVGLGDTTTETEPEETVGDEE